jgi:hypothetical protein
MDPLNGVRFKIVRAQEHHDLLDQKVGAFLASKPYTTLIDVDEQTWEFRVRVDVHRETDPYWAVIIGDLVHNLRSALDHLAWALVQVNGNKPTKRTQFPIFTDQGEFEADGRRMIAGVSAEATALLESLQPYVRRNPADHPLEVIRLLSNRDKHHLLYTTAFIPSGLEQRLSRVIGSGRLEIYEVAQGPITDGTVILRGRLVPSPTFENVKVNFQFASEIVVSERWSLNTVLNDLIPFVRDQVVPRFHSVVRRPLRTLAGPGEPRSSARPTP